MLILVPLTPSTKILMLERSGDVIFVKLSDSNTSFKASNVVLIVEFV